jgi:hypothetical protein
MPEPFLSFAKAFVAREYHVTKKVSLNRDLQALRAVCEALEADEGKCCPTLLTSEILNSAAALVKRKYSAETAHAISAAISHIAEVVDENFIGRVALQWKNPITFKSPRSRVGNNFEEHRKKRLPSSVLLVALGKAYQKASHPEDIVYSSMCAIMLSSPDRANEVASLLEDCESSTNGDGTPGYALRWWPSKSAPPQLKIIPSVMQDLVKDAIARIRDCTRVGRMLAKFYEDQITSEHPYPRHVYLPEKLEYLRHKEFLTKDEISLIFWGETGHAMDSWCRIYKVEGIPVPGTKRQIHRFLDVERAILMELPLHFPYSDNTKAYKCSELLFTMQKFSNTKRRPCACMYVAMDRLDLNYRLDSRNTCSLFANVNLAEIVNDNEEPFKITSHQFRHYLNHLAHAQGELTEVDIDLWSGRTSRGEAYNHLSSEEISDRAAELIEASSPSLPVIKNKKDIKLYARAEFKRLGVTVGHTTEFGYCIHDFAATPCQKHQECLDCNEQFCIKGDVEKEQNLRFERDELEHFVSIAEEAVAKEKYGADRWLARQQINLARAKELLGIIDDSRVPYGTAIRLTGLKNYSRIEHARNIEKQAALISVTDEADIHPKEEFEFSLLGNK